MSNAIIENDKLQIFLYSEESSNANKGSILNITVNDLNDRFYEIAGTFTDNHWEQGSAIDDEETNPLYLPTEILEIIENPNNSKIKDNYLIIISVSNEYLLKHIGELQLNNFENFTPIKYLQSYKFKNFVPNFYLKSSERSMGATLNSIQKFNQTNSCLMVVAPPMTGTSKLYKSLTQNNIDFIDLINEPNRFSFFNKYDKIKIITTIREPIIQGLSVIYQQLASPFENYFNFVMRKSFQNQEHFTQSSKSIYLFHTIYTLKKDKLPPNLYTDRYIEIFNTTIFNLYEHEFDKEKGYGIISQGNIEVFVYQQEKIDDITSELSDWIGQTQFGEWELPENDLPQWITPHFELVQKEIRFSQEFFDSCYNQQWVKHFYSQEDIDKFKTKWQPHIQ